MQTRIPRLYVDLKQRHDCKNSWGEKRSINISQSTINTNHISKQLSAPSLFFKCQMFPYSFGNLGRTKLEGAGFMAACMGWIQLRPHPVFSTQTVARSILQKPLPFQLSSLQLGIAMFGFVRLNSVLDSRSAIGSKAHWELSYKS